MHFRIFTLHPAIFESFQNNSLIARAISQSIITLETINWREKYGIGNYRQLDDKPYGGGEGMVLMAEPIYQALSDHGVVSPLYNPPKELTEHTRIIPNNSTFYSYWMNPSQSVKKATISLTPRGHRFTQSVAQWLSGFEELTLLCGRYEGFDARVSEMVDLELSIGDFVLNGGEVAAMALIESIARLVPGYITKSNTVRHDSFSSTLNLYHEQKEFVVGKHRLGSEKATADYAIQTISDLNLFNDQIWKQEILPKIEHPQYTRPETWMNWQIPKLLSEGNHKKIQDWRSNWSQSS